jgi:hypothetical protein
MDSVPRQAYEGERTAAAERYSGHELEQAFFHLERGIFSVNRFRFLMHGPTGGC